jgi:predicted DCC family thiol-disulfide oxidoreductase YuxK
MESRPDIILQFAHHLARVWTEERKIAGVEVRARVCARRLDGLWPLLSVFFVIPRPLRDAVYDWIGRRRYRMFGRRDVCWTPQAEIADRFLD